MGRGKDNDRLRQTGSARMAQERWRRIRRGRGCNSSSRSYQRILEEVLRMLSKNNGNMFQILDCISMKLHLQTKSRLSHGIHDESNVGSNVSESDISIEGLSNVLQSKSSGRYDALYALGHRLCLPHCIFPPCSFISTGAYDPRLRKQFCIRFRRVRCCRKWPCQRWILLPQRSVGAGKRTP